jgi:hypothetical protein
MSAGGRGEVLEALLQAHIGGRPVDQATRETFRQLLAAVQAGDAPSYAPAGAMAASPVIERGLREVIASSGDTETMLRVLRQLAAEQARVQPAKAQPW